MRLFVLLSALALTGCETYSEDHARISGTIDSLVGQPVASAISVLGVPSSTAPAGSATIYVWSKDNVYYPGVESSLGCEIRLMVDQSETITKGNWQGNNYACQELARRL